MTNKKDCGREKRFRFAFLLTLLTLVSVPVRSSAEYPYPRTFNFYGRNYFEPADIANLAKYDIISLDVDSPDSILVAIKAVKPSIKILAYLPINGTWSNALAFPADSKWREMYEVISANNWWLWNTAGGHVSDHVSKWTANTTALCPVNAQGKNYLDWFPEFITQSVLENGNSPWDGVFLDNVWIGIWFINTNATLNPFPIDADRDGIADAQPTLDLLWSAGNDTLIQRMARAMPPGELLTGNGQNSFYEMNGAMIETFPFKGLTEPGHPLGYTWLSKMFSPNGYFSIEDNYLGVPKVNIINTKWPYGDRYNPDRTPEYGRRKRFVMGSTMLRDAYVSIDIGLEAGGAHFSIWWEPEYEKPIGSPLGPPYQAVYGGTTLWRRDYSNGSIILNHNWSTFLGSPSSNIPPISYCDALILLNSEFWNPAENEPPGRIQDLIVTRTWENQIEVQWTNVGDNGTEGQAVEMEARYSLSDFTPPGRSGDVESLSSWGENLRWIQASVVASHPVPALPGLTQKLIIPGLAKDKTYYVAVRTRDMAGNWSPISNSASGLTTNGDTTPPATVSNLAILSTTSTRATIRWTATGDDGNSGTASFFDVRYAQFQINSSNMNSASAVTGEPVPGFPGTIHTMQILGLVPNRTYYFMIRVGDEQPNWSGLSNIPFAVTLPGDSIPPAPIVDLHVTAVEPTAITLAWTAPGDDGMAGRANIYDLRYATYPINASNWDGTGYIVGEPGPVDGGQAQSFRVANLGIGYTYYFAMKTSDEWPNWSLVSNTTYAHTSLVSGVEGTIPARLELGPGNPNPTNAGTRIDYALPAETAVTLDVHDVGGRRVTTLVSGTLPAGRYQAEWDGRDESGRDVASGIYFIRLVAGPESRNQKVMIRR